MKIMNKGADMLDIKLYSTIRMKRLMHNNKVAYHRGIVIKISMNCIDVSFQTQGENRIIRMNYHTDKFIYFDNDNDSVIVVDKLLSNSFSKVKEQYLKEHTGLGYELTRLDQFYHFDTVLTIAQKSGVNYTNGIFNSKDLNTEDERKYGNLLLAHFANIGGVMSDKMQTLINLIGTNGLDVYTITSLLKIFTDDEINQLQEIIINKNDACNNKDYEVAAGFRDKEQTFQNKFKNNRKMAKTEEYKTIMTEEDFAKYLDIMERKLKFIKSQDYERAAECRDEERTILIKYKQL